MSIKVIFIFVIVFLSSCGGFFPSPPQTRQFMLTEFLCSEIKQGKDILLIRNLNSPPFLRTNKVTYKVFDKEIKYYALTSWTDTPMQALETALREKLLCSGRFSDVSIRSSTLPAVFILEGDLLDFSFDDSGDDRIVQAVFDARLIDANYNNLLVTKRFVVSKTIQSNASLENIIDSFTEAFQELVAQVSEWAVHSVPKSSE